MFICSKAPGQKIYHTEQCAFAKRINPENIQYFQTMEDAESKGYHACEHCSKLSRMYRRQKKQILSFCKKTGLECFMRKGRVAIRTPADKWLIAYDYRRKRFAVYHQNHSNEKDNNAIIAGYHDQKWAFVSIYDTLLAVYDHTCAYLDKHTVPGFVKGNVSKMLGKPQPNFRSQKRKKEKAAKKRQERRQSIRHVLDLIDDLH